MTTTIDPVSAATMAELPSITVSPVRTVRKRLHIGSSVKKSVDVLGSAAIGFALFSLAWQLIAMRSGRIPTPADTAIELQELLGRAFTKDATHGTGIGLQLWSSLGRVFRGFGLAAAAGIPIGLAIGSSKRAWRMFNPVVQILRPVSPLAWFPIWLVVFKDAPKAAVFVIFITALWPIVINSAAGAQSIPTDHRNVSKVFGFSRWQTLRHVIVPDALPTIINGLRTSMGVAWMVIVAVEMLSGGRGIGFYVWDAYNASNLAGVTAAIILIGSVGLILDAGFMRLGRAIAPVGE